MRSMRMIATVLLLQSRGRMTARELATELEISVATARRDLEALSMAGVPVYPQAGRGGGWALVGGARTDLSGLTASESQALFLLIGSASEASMEAQSAVRKLLRALPGTFAEDAEAAAQAVRSDDAGWGELARERPAQVEVAQTAIVQRRKVVLEYVNRTGRASTVTVSPLGLIDKNEIWYLLATRDGAAVRTYRMDRVVSVETTDEPAERPDGFDLAAEWQKVTELVESRRSLVSATVLIASRHVEVLRGIFGRHLVVVDHDQERTRVRVAAHTARSVAEQLAGWGAMVEVTEPPEVRQELARIGDELVARYP